MSERVQVNGKHLSAGAQPHRVAGVTYGSFARRFDGAPFPERATMKHDFAAMADLGLNTVRVYDLPPAEMLDIADEFGLRLIVGLHYRDWTMEPHAGRRSARRIADAGIRAIDLAMERLAGRPTVLAVAVGNEVPGDLVRLHGASSVAETLSRLIERVHIADPLMPATYVSYPTTEFLEVDGQDVSCFNVFLEQEPALRRYLGHLQVVAADRPLILTELGLAAGLHGEPAQAQSLRAQLKAVDEAGAAGATVFAWTDEWAVDGTPVDGWGFGITDSQREPKPAAAVVADWAMADAPQYLRPSWPLISAIVCAYNEERTIDECLESLARSPYPDLEVIVCDDGSTDRTLELARRWPFRVLALEHGGLSRARNAGLAAARGEQVAYLDADASCHPHWPFHLALSLEDPQVAATGGPNLPYADAGFIERAVARSPGGPREVLIASDQAEHVPGCNMAFRADALRGIGGFDPAYATAGDDVDVCWKLADAGHRISFSPAAQVLHHRRSTVAGFLRQQQAYGRAERMLSGPHRHRFNRLRQARWSGAMYGGSRVLPALLKPVVYSGVMGMAPFQPILKRRSEAVAQWAAALLPLTVPIALAGLPLAALSPVWLLLTLAAVLAAGAYAAAIALALSLPPSEPSPVKLRLVVGGLHVLQSIARAWGRLTARPLPAPSPQPPPWSGDRVQWLSGLARELQGRGLAVRTGLAEDPWDLEAWAGGLAKVRLTTAVAWSWQPRWRLRYLPRAALMVAIGLNASLLALPVRIGWHASGIIGAWLCVDWVRLRMAVTQALSRSTDGASGRTLCVQAED
ncbi:MAG TPA: glycosyltransferase [Egibacteraceae bacterium]|nr:glycosyltransferase [Egibacteraceae bacterium]